MNNNNMNYIMEHLENAVTELEKIMQVMLPTEYAVYVDMDQELHYISVQDALSLIDDFGKNCMIGKSDYILVYDEDRRIVVDGNAYLLGGFIVMRSDYGLKGLGRGDIDKIMEQMAGRMSTFAMGQYRMQAYQLG